jgi:hypothetical protein
MLGELAREREAHCRLDLARREGALLVVAHELAGLVGDLVEDVGDEGVHDRHSLGRDARVGVHLLEHLVNVDGVGLAPLLLALPAFGALSLGLLLLMMIVLLLFLQKQSLGFRLLFLDLLFLRLGGHAEAHVVDESFSRPPLLFKDQSLPINTSPRALGATATRKSLRRHKAARLALRKSAHLLCHIIPRALLTASAPAAPSTQPERGAGRQGAHREFIHSFVRASGGALHGRRRASGGGAEGEGGPGGGTRSRCGCQRGRGC